MAAMRAAVQPNKGKLEGVAARGPFHAIMERVLRLQMWFTRLTVLGAFRDGGFAPKMHGQIKPSCTFTEGGSTLARPEHFAILQDISQRPLESWFSCQTIVLHRNTPFLLPSRMFERAISVLLIEAFRRLQLRATPLAETGARPARLFGTNP